MSQKTNESRKKPGLEHTYPKTQAFSISQWMCFSMIIIGLIVCY